MGMANSSIVMPIFLYMCVCYKHVLHTSESFCHVDLEGFLPHDHKHRGHTGFTLTIVENKIVVNVHNIMLLVTHDEKCVVAFRAITWPCFDQRMADYSQQCDSILM